MAQSVHEIVDGQLERLIREAGQKLVAVDFSNPGCPPCRAIKPFWDSLPSKYPNVIFATVQCNSCPTESRNFNIRATPTFVFLMKGQTVQRIEGVDKNAIISTIEQYKSDYHGQGRTLGGPPPGGNNNYFESLLGNNNTRAPPPPPPPPAAATTTTAAVPKPKVIDPEIRQNLLDMEFAEDLVDAALRNTDGTFDRCFEYIEKVQKGEIKINEKPVDTSMPHAADEESAEILAEELGPEGEAMKAKLVEMGYNETLATVSIQVMGHDSIEKCVDGIQRMLRGENIAPPLSEAEKKAKLEEIKARIAAKKAAAASPSIHAKDELSRRKATQEGIESRKKFEEMKRENDLKLARKEKEAAKAERERVLAKIKAQRTGNSENQQAAPAAAAAPPPAKKEITECQLKLVLPDNSSHVLTFKPNDTLADVEKSLRSASPSLPKKIAFEMTWPRQLFESNQFASTLKALQLCPRSQLNVKYT